MKKSSTFNSKLFTKNERNKSDFFIQHTAYICCWRFFVYLYILCPKRSHKEMEYHEFITNKCVFGLFFFQRCVFFPIPSFSTDFFFLYFVCVVSFFFLFASILVLSPILLLLFLLSFYTKFIDSIYSS